MRNRTTSPTRQLRRPLMALTLAGITLVGSANLAAADTTPTPAEIAAAQAEAARLSQAVSSQQAAVNAATVEINRLAGIAAAAQAEEAQAREDEMAAVADQLNAQSEVTQATKDLKAQTKALGNWAAGLYTSGVADPKVYQLQILLGSKNLEDVSQSMGVLDSASKQQSQVVNDAKELESAKKTAEERATAAQERAKQAHDRAVAAATTAAAAVKQQAAKVAELKSLLAAQQSKLTVAQRDAQALMTKRLAALAAQRTNASKNYDSSTNPNNKITGPVANDCPGGDISGFANGQIPTELLCPLWAAPGHKLRADAANQFNQMSQAFAAQFGTPICVTDSYRTLAAQIAVKLQKGYLAATPGKSNHGWARATDLCGGIQNFGTPQHEWLKANGGRYGWYHPGWAEPSGSKPEPWHWEFTW